MWYVSTHFNWTRWLQITEHIRLRLCVYVLYIVAINLHRWIARARLFSSVHYIRSNIDWASGWETESERYTESIDWNDSMRIGFLFFAIFASEFLPFTFSRWKCDFFFFHSFAHFILIIQTEFACLLFLCVAKYLLCDCCLRRSLLFFSLLLFVSVSISVFILPPHHARTRNLLILFEHAINAGGSGL